MYLYVHMHVAVSVFLYSPSHSLRQGLSLNLELTNWIGPAVQGALATNLPISAYPVPRLQRAAAVLAGIVTTGELTFRQSLC